MGVMLSPIEYEHRPRPGTHRGPGWWWAGSVSDNGGGGAATDPWIGWSDRGGYGATSPASRVADAIAARRPAVVLDPGASATPGSHECGQAGACPDGRAVRPADEHAATVVARKVLVSAENRWLGPRSHVTVGCRQETVLTGRATRCGRPQ